MYIFTYLYICIYIYIYLHICIHIHTYACFFRWTCVFAYAWEMERWAKFRCQEISFSNSLDHINWSLIHLLLELDMWWPSMPIRLCPGHWSLVSWLAFLRIPAPISVQHLQDGVAILMARLLQTSFSNSEPWSFYSGYHFWPSLFWQWVTPGYPVGCFRCRQLFVASDGARGWRPCIVPRLTEKGAEKGK